MAQNNLERIDFATYRIKSSSIQDHIVKLEFDEPIVAIHFTREEIQALILKLQEALSSD